VGLSSVPASETADSPTAEVSADSTRTAYGRGLYGHAERFGLHGDVNNIMQARAVSMFRLQCVGYIDEKLWEK